LKVKIQYLGYIRTILNKREEHFELNDGASLYDLLNKQAGIHGAVFRKEVYEPGRKKVKTGFSVTVNGVLISQLGGLDFKLSEDDNIILMSLMSGG